MHGQLPAQAGRDHPADLPPPHIQPAGRQARVVQQRLLQRRFQVGTLWLFCSNFYDTIT